jgi:hypothetical protein
MYEVIILIVAGFGFAIYFSGQRAQQAARKPAAEFLDAESVGSANSKDLAVVYPWTIGVCRVSGEARNYDNSPFFKFKQYYPSTNKVLYLETLEGTFVVARMRSHFAFHGPGSNTNIFNWKNWPLIGRGDLDQISFIGELPCEINCSLMNLIRDRVDILLPDGRQAHAWQTGDGCTALCIPHEIPGFLRVCLAGYLFSRLTSYH